MDNLLKYVSGLRDNVRTNYENDSKLLSNICNNLNTTIKTKIHKFKRITRVTRGGFATNMIYYCFDKNDYLLFTITITKDFLASLTEIDNIFINIVVTYSKNIFRYYTQYNMPSLKLKHSYKKDGHLLNSDTLSKISNFIEYNLLKK